MQPKIEEEKKAQLTEEQVQKMEAEENFFAEVNRVKQIFINHYTRNL